MASKKLKARHLTKFNVPCAFGGQASEVAIYIGAPEAKHNPIYFQSKFIQDVRGGVIPQGVIESLEKLHQLSEENGVAFEELCRYALSSLNASADQGAAVAQDTAAPVSAAASEPQGETTAEKKDENTDGNS